MPEEKDVNQNLAWEQNWLRFEKLSWAIMAALLASACLGLTGPGHFSKRQVAVGSLRVEYEHFLHSTKPSEVVLSLDPSATTTGRVGITLSGALVGDARVEGSRPAAAAQASAGKNSRMEFLVTHGRPAEIVLTQHPESWGAVESHIVLDDGTQVVLPQFIYP